MFSFKIITPVIIFLIFLIITSIIKNQTRIIEKKIHKLNKNISLTEKDINEFQLEFYFLSSPAEVEKRIRILDNNNYAPIKNSNIFLSFSEFTNIQKKISIFKIQNEEEIKKN
jgi:cell division protein FtsL